jgi:transcriptional regulator with XRE-family HTH domain
MVHTMSGKENLRFAGRLKELREGAGLTQQQLGERSGMHKLTVAKLEQGIREPSWATVQALAGALGVTCEAFTTPPADREPQGRGRPPKPVEKEPPPKRPRGRPKNDATAASSAKRKAKGE